MIPPTEEGTVVRQQVHLCSHPEQSILIAVSTTDRHHEFKAKVPLIGQQLA